MTRQNKFAVFILSNGRPDNVCTYHTLKRQGYTGPIYIIIDNEDKTGPEYQAQFGDQVIIFDKLAISRQFDQGDNFNNRRAVFYARNASFAIAQQLGLDFFLQLDDDYMGFVYKFSPSLQYLEKPVRNLDLIFQAMLKYYQRSGALAIAFAQCGDFIGGGAGSFGKEIKLSRKCMNTFFCSTHRPFAFVGRVNEDVNTYTSLGNRGGLLLTIPIVAIHQLKTQSNQGGMTDLYLTEGTYIKSFYTVMYAPSCTKVSVMGQNHRRLHHKINWANAVPCILDPGHRKTAREL